MLVDALLPHGLTFGKHLDTNLLLYLQWLVRVRLLRPAYSSGS